MKICGETRNLAAVEKNRELYIEAQVRYVIVGDVLEVVTRALSSGEVMSGFLG